MLTANQSAQIAIRNLVRAEKALSKNANSLDGRSNLDSAAQALRWMEQAAFAAMSR